MAKGIQSISLGFRILRAITDSDAPAPLKTLAAASEMSPSDPTATSAPTSKPCARKSA